VVRVRLLLLLAALALLACAWAASADPGITHDFVTLHSCDSTSGVTPVGDASISVNNVYYKEGAGALNIYKPYTTTNQFGIEISFSATSFRDKLFVFWLYVRSNALSKLSNIRLVFYDSSNNYGYRDVSPSTLNPDGWKSIVYMVPFRSQGGYYLTDPPFGDLNYYAPAYPDVTKIVRVRIEFYTKSASDTVSEGDLVVDWIKLGRSIIVTEGVVGNLFTRVAQYDRQNALGVVDYMDGNVLIKGAQIVIGDGVSSYTCSSFGESVAIAVPQEAITFVYVRKFSKLVIGQQVTGKLGKDGSTFNVYGSPYYVYLFRGEDLTYSYLEIWQGQFNFYNLIRGRYNGMFMSNINAKVYNAVFTNAYITVYRATFELYNVVTMRGESGIWGGTCLGLEDYKSFNETAPITFEYSQRATVVRLTAKSNTYLVRLFSFFGNVTLVDAVTDSFNRYWAGTASQNTGTVHLAFTFSPRLVDALGNPVPGARVRLVSSQGTIAYDDYTNASGHAPAKVVVSRVWRGRGQTGVNADTETDYNPFTLEVYKDNMKVYSARVTIMSPFTQDITVVYAISPRAEVGKSYYYVGEPAAIYAQFSDLSGVRVTGLTVNAYVTMPNGDVRLVPLNDDGVPPDQVAGDGVYTGLFTETHLAGTYYVTVEAVIYGSVFQHRCSFEVGKLENLIANVNTTLVNKIKSVNDTVIGLNSTLSRQIASVNSTVSALSSQIASVNSTVVSVNSTVASLANTIASALSKIRVDLSPVLERIDQSTSTILDAISKVSSQVRQLQEAPKPAEVTVPSWVVWLLVAQALLLLFIYLAVRRRGEAAVAPQLQPPSGSRIAKIAFAAVFLAASYLLLSRLSAYIPIPVPAAMGLAALLALLALKLGARKALALVVILGAAGYLAWALLSTAAASMSTPLPAASLAIALALLTIIYMALRRRRKRREVMVP
jgi:hypothetical protein